MRTKITLVVALLVFGLAAIGTIYRANAELPSPLFQFRIGPMY
jgi:hypothetical protein